MVISVCSYVHNCFFSNFFKSRNGTFKQDAYPAAIDFYKKRNRIKQEDLKTQPSCLCPVASC